MRYSVSNLCPLLLLLSLFVFGPGEAAAQDTLGLHIRSLTVAEGHALMAEEGVDVVYTCIPAGVVVFKSDGTEGSREDLRTRIIAKVATIVGQARIQGSDLTLQAAEAACQTVRGQ